MTLGAAATARSAADRVAQGVRGEAERADYLYRCKSPGLTKAANLWRTNMSLRSAV
jgi:hypothetical protein